MREKKRLRETEGMENRNFSNCFLREWAIILMSIPFAYNTQAQDTPSLPLYKHAHITDSMLYKDKMLAFNLKTRIHYSQNHDFPTHEFFYHHESKCQANSAKLHSWKYFCLKDPNAQAAASGGKSRSCCGSFVCHSSVPSAVSST